VAGAQQLGAHARPEVWMQTLGLAEYMNCIYRGDGPDVGAANQHDQMAHLSARRGRQFVHATGIVAGQASRPDVRSRITHRQA
jgi:hypothetical protein